MNKTDLIHKIKALEGLNQDERAYLINLVNTKKKYGLVWEDKPEAVEEELRDKLPVLKEVKEKAIVNGEEHPNHILIEGDNLHALTALTFTHEGKIDVIYIDPPYNTGSNDFRYNDNYVDKDDDFRHSKWLSFINKRLSIAKTLMKKNGVIFISINEEEFSQLKLLCDEIFNHRNYLTTFTIKVRHENRILKGDKDFHEVTEYLLMYRKSSDFQTVKRVQDNTSLDLYTYQIKELIQNPEKIVLDGKEVLIFQPNEYQIIRTDPSQNSLKCISIRGSIKEGNSSGRFFMKHFAKSIGKEFGLLFRVADMGDDELPYRYFKLPESPKRVNGDYFQGVPVNRSDTKDVPFPNFFDFVDEFNNVGYEGDIEFRNGKKPIKFLHKIFEISGLKNGVILDFFAGSGSTLHSTMEFNKDGGNRQCILVTNNENNICEEVTYERNKRVIQGYTNAKGGEVAGLAINNLRYYKSEFVSREPSLKNKRELTQLATELLCIKEDCYSEQRIILSKGRLFSNTKVSMLVLYDDHAIPQAVDFIKTYEGPSLKVYVFSIGSDPYTDDFAEVLHKVSLCALPDAIYKAYRSVLPARKSPKRLEEDAAAAEQTELNLFNQPTP